ncbi:MAG: ABC transporter ATP-binding protein [Anaerolineae bacterium]|nr:ABC transporter ATP-binding protein [Anaerolineae bacterium]
MSATASTKPMTPVDTDAPPEDNSNKVLGRLLEYMIGGDKRRPFYIAMIWRVIATAGLVAMPWIIGQSTDALTAGDYAGVTQWTIYAIIAMIIFIAFSYISERDFANLAADGAVRQLRALFDHMQGLSLSFFDRQPLGQLLSRVVNDSDAVSTMYSEGITRIIRDIVQLSLLVVAMLLISWQLAIFVLATLPVMFYITSSLQRVARPAFGKFQEELGTISGFQEETIAGNKVILTNRRGEWAGERNKELAGNVFEVGREAYFHSLLSMPVLMASVIIQIAIVLFVGGILVGRGEIELGVIVSFIGYAAILSQPLGDIANRLGQISQAVAGGKRIFEILDEEPTVLDAADARPFEFKGGHVEFKDVTFSYVKGRRILKHNTFEALPGQKIGLCGPTGAGKSTIINILTRYYDIDSGQILIDGQDLRSLSQASLREQIGVVLQEAFLFSDTVMNNLKYARANATDEECIAAAKEANADEFITNLPQGYDTMLTERGANLSQGQRQMITIARAMVAQPKVLVLDEATSNVDTRTEKLIQGGLARLMEGRTSFVIAHRLSTIRDSAKILVINGGEIVEQGPHDELMAMKGFYYTLYMSQFKGKAPGGEAAGTSTFASS